MSTAAAESVRDVVVAGRRMRVSVRPGRGTPLLVCNGIGAGLGLLDPFVEALDPSIPVVRFDPPGVGGSQLPLLPYTFATLAYALGRVLDELGHDRVDVLGYSWGGGLAQQFAVQHPRRCRRVVLVATGTGWMMIPGRPDSLTRLLVPGNLRDPERVASIAGPMFGGDLRDVDLARDFMAGPGRAMTTGPGYLLQLGAASGWATMHLLPMLRQPALVMGGTDDPVVPLGNAKILHHLLPHSELHVYDDGHLGVATRADELAPRVAGFLRGGVGESPHPPRDYRVTR